jgi:hypothetical protein
MVVDLRPLYATSSLAWILAAGVLASRWSGSGVSPFVRALLVAASLIVVRNTVPVPAGLWIALALFAVIVLRLWRSALCLAGYVAGVFFLGAFGVLEQHRLVHTFSFTLYVGIAFLLLEEPGRKESVAATLQWKLPVAVAAVVAILYLGSFVIPSATRETYLREVHGKPGMALKIGDDARIDRSLYYLGSRQFVYTRSDELEIGAVRRARGLATSSTSNPTFKAPNAFVD